jgi:hypothetical protein
MTDKQTETLKELVIRNIDLMGVENIEIFVDLTEGYEIHSVSPNNETVNIVNSYTDKSIEDFPVVSLSDVVIDNILYELERELDKMENEWNKFEENNDSDDMGF